MSEHDEQVALFQWSEYMANANPELKLLFAVPNGGHRHISVASKLKAEGVKAGVPDVFLPVPKGKFSGLFIEMKAKGGKPSSYQQWWLAELKDRGYRAEVCVGFESAKSLIEEYLWKS